VRLAPLRGRQVPLRVHAVMQQAQNVNDPLPLGRADTKHHEVPPLVPVPGNVKRANVASDVVAKLGADKLRSGVQRR